MTKQWSAGDEVLAADINPAVVPTGAILAWGAAAAPAGWILCDGASLLRAGTYADLFAVIGTTYGTADGSHFNVPNMKGKVIVGFNSAETEFDALGETGGEKTHQLSVAEMPAHTHNIETNSGTGTGGVQPKDVGVDLASGSAGGDTAHNNLQPYLTLHYIIKY
jgi:microcystin-dependent protein